MKTKDWLVIDHKRHTIDHFRTEEEAYRFLGDLIEDSGSYNIEVCKVIKEMKK